MSYEPIGWKTGNTITAEKLNKMDKGWGFSKDEQIFSRSNVAVVYDSSYDAYYADLEYSGTLSSEDDALLITINGFDYLCEPVEYNGASYFGGVDNYGNIDLGTYPFCIISDGESTEFISAFEGTYDIEVSTGWAEISDPFAKAVTYSAPIPHLCISGVTTFNDMSDFYNGRMLCFLNGTNMYIITSLSFNNISFMPEDASITATFVNEVFTVSSTV